MMVDNGTHKLLGHQANSISSVSCPPLLVGACFRNFQTRAYVRSWDLFEPVSIWQFAAWVKSEVAAVEIELHINSWGKSEKPHVYSSEVLAVNSHKAPSTAEPNHNDITRNQFDGPGQ